MLNNVIQTTQNNYLLSVYSSLLVSEDMLPIILKIIYKTQQNQLAQTSFNTQSLTIKKNRLVASLTNK